MEKSYNTSMTNQQHVLIWNWISHNYQHVSSTSSIYITPHMSKSSTYINITLTVLTSLHILVTSVNSVDIWQIKFHAHYRELYVQNTSRNKKFRKSVSYINATGLRNFGPGITAQKRRLRNYLFRKTDNWEFLMSKYMHCFHTNWLCTVVSSRFFRFYETFCFVTQSPTYQRHNL
jgi:hypothetical protein